jgi:hypothetical protein
MFNKRNLILLFAFLAVFLNSCESKIGIDNQSNNNSGQINSTSDNNSETPEVAMNKFDITTVENCDFGKIYPADLIGELVNFTGDKPGSATFSLESETTIRVFWNQTSKENFVLSGTNLDPNLADSPSRTLVFESFVGPSSGCVDVTLNSGKYQMNIENTDSNWQVAVYTIKYKK